MQRICARVGARENEHVVDEPSKTARLCVCRRQRVAIFSLVALLATQRDVRNSTDDRDRRAELVRRIGHELPLRLERAAKAPDKAVAGGTTSHMGHRPQAD